MGLYNEITVDCPKCSTEIVFQSKSGECMMRSYPIKAMPPEDFAGIVGDSETCPVCNRVVTILTEPREHIRPQLVDLSNWVSTEDY